MFGSSGATLCDSCSAAVVPDTELETEEKVLGSFKEVQWPNGHAMTIARPTTEVSATVPP